jgi:hypothetical protein
MIAQIRYTDEELRTIIDQGAIYMCACPSQVAQTIQHIRQLHQYQIGCLTDTQNDPSVHQLIADTATKVHADLEACMDKIIELEKWDRKTLKICG